MNTDRTDSGIVITKSYIRDTKAKHLTRAHSVESANERQLKAFQQTFHRSRRQFVNRPIGIPEP